MAGPWPQSGCRGRVVTRRGRRQCAGREVVRSGHDQGHQERGPRLIRADDDHDQDQMDVGLAQAVGDMDERRRRQHRPGRRDGRTQRRPKPRQFRQSNPAHAANAANATPGHDRCTRLAGPHGAQERDQRTMRPQQALDPPLPGAVRGTVERCTTRQPLKDRSGPMGTSPRAAPNGRVVMPHADPCGPSTHARRRPHASCP